MPRLRKKKHIVQSKESEDLDENKPVFVKNQRKQCKGCGCKPRDLHNATACEIIRKNVNVLVQKRIVDTEHKIKPPVKAVRNVCWPVEYRVLGIKDTFKPYRSFEVSFKREGLTVANVKSSKQLHVLFDSIVNVLCFTAKRWSLFPQLGGLMAEATSSYLNSITSDEPTMEQLCTCLQKYLLEKVLHLKVTNEYSMIPKLRDFKAAVEVKKLARDLREDGLPGIIVVTGNFLPTVKLDEWNVTSAEKYFNNSDRMIRYFRMLPNSPFKVKTEKMRLKDWPTCKDENSTGRSGVLNSCFTSEDTDRPESLLGGFEEFINNALGDDYEVIQIYLHLKERDYCTGPHQDIHELPHITVYQQLFGESMFLSMPRSLNAFFDYIVLKKKNAELYWKNARRTLQNSSNCAVQQYTLRAGETLIVTPSCGHTVFVPSNSRFSIVRAAKVLPKRLHNSLEKQGVNLNVFKIRVESEEPEKVKRRRRKKRRLHQRMSKRKNKRLNKRRN